MNANAILDITPTLHQSVIQEFVELFRFYILYYFNWTTTSVKGQ